MARVRLGIRVAVIAGLCVWIWAWRSGQGPVVDGLTLDQWLELSFQYEDGAYQNNGGQEFNRAIANLGTNAIPHLIKRLRTRDVPWSPLARRVLGTKITPAVASTLRLNRGWVERRRAVNGFRALGSVAIDAIPDLLASYPRAPFEVCEVFDSMGSSTLPQLEQHIRNGEVETKIAAMSALSTRAFDYKREETVAIWVECLTNEAPRIRRFAATLLGNTRPIRAQAAIPRLQAAVHDSDQEVALAAQGALKKLQPANK